MREILRNRFPWRHSIHEIRSPPIPDAGTRVDFAVTMLQPLPFDFLIQRDQPLLPGQPIAPDNRAIWIHSFNSFRIAGTARNRSLPSQMSRPRLRALALSSAELSGNNL